MARDVRGSGVDRHVDLLIALLVRYPEISSVHVLSSAATMELTFLLREAPDEAAFAAFERQLGALLGALSRLDGMKRRLDVRRQGYDGLFRLVVGRDLGTLAAEEFEIVVGIVRERFGDVLSVDEGAGAATIEDDGDEAIVGILEALRRRLPKQQLIGIRDGGRVLVFDEAEL